MEVIELLKDIELPQVNVNKKYSKEEQKFFRVLKMRYKEEGYSHPKCGEILYFNTDDGLAYYMFLEMNPLKLLYLPIKNKCIYTDIIKIKREYIEEILVFRTKKKGGRPKINKEESLGFKRIFVSYTSKEYDELIKLASEFDLKLSNYIKIKSLTEGEIKGKFVRKDFKELNLKLSKVGNNLNQLTKAVNVGSFRFKDENSDKLFKELNDLFVEIIMKI